MRVLLATVLVLGAVGAVVGCGDQELEAAAALPPSGTAYRALNDGERLAVAASCRDRAAARADGVAAEELGRVDPGALRDQLDAAFRRFRNQPRAVAELCAEHLPFVTPGLRLRFDEAKDSGDAFTYETESDKPLTIRGAVSPARSGTVTVRREVGSAQTYGGRIGPDGRFVLPTLRLRKIANNTFILSFNAPPSAPRKAYFSAICLDCLAGGPPPSAGQ
jgi:hypothetical protein